MTVARRERRVRCLLIGAALACVVPGEASCQLPGDPGPSYDSINPGEPVIGVSWGYVWPDDVHSDDPTEFVALYVSRFDGAPAEELKTVSLGVRCYDAGLIAARPPAGRTFGLLTSGPVPDVNPCGDEQPTWLVFGRFDSGYPLRPSLPRYDDWASFTTDTSVDWDNYAGNQERSHHFLTLEFDDVPTLFEVSAYGSGSGIRMQKWPDRGRTVIIPSPSPFNISLDSGIKPLYAGGQNPFSDFEPVIIVPTGSYPDVWRAGIIFDVDGTLLLDQCAGQGTVPNGRNWTARSFASPYHGATLYSSAGDPPLTDFGRELARSEVVGLPIVVSPVVSEWVSVY